MDTNVKIEVGPIFNKVADYLNKKWQIVKEDNPTISTYPIGQRVVIKSETKLQTSLTLTGFATFFQDTSNQTQYNQTLQSIQILQKCQDYRILKQKTKSLWPMDPRQLIIVNFSKIQGNKFYYVSKSIEWSQPVQKGFIRAECHLMCLIVQQLNGQYKLTMIGDMDPKGSIPDLLKKSMVNKRGEVILKLKDLLEKKYKK